MNLASSIVLGLTAFTILFGALLGLIRGRNRAILRLIFVTVSVILAVALRSTVVSAIMNFEVDGTTLHDTLAQEFMSAEANIPVQIQDLIFTLIEVILGLIAFFVLFFVIKFITWLIVFPIAKIFVRKGEKKRKLVGALIGAAQGFLIAFVVCAPLSGILVQLNDLSKMEIQGKPAFEIPEEIGVEAYVDSTPCNFYNTTGGWFFDMISTAKDANGNKISIKDTCNIVTTVAGIANTVTKLSDNLESMSVASTPQQQVDSIKNIGDTLIEIGNSVDSLSADAKNVVQGVMDSVKEMITSEGEPLPPDIESAIDNLDINNIDLVSVGEAINGIATYIEKTNSEFDQTDEPITQDEINDIVNGFANNEFIIDLFAADSSEVPQIISADESTMAMFESAINNSSASAQHKETLKKMFGTAN